MNNAELKEFTDQFLKIPDNQPPIKQKYIMANNFMIKLLRKEVMHRSKLRNQFLKKET